MQVLVNQHSFETRCAVRISLSLQLTEYSILHFQTVYMYSQAISIQKSRFRITPAVDNVYQTPLQRL